MTLSENDELEGGHGIIASEWQEAGASLGEGFRLMLQLVTVGNSPVTNVEQCRSWNRTRNLLTLRTAI